MCVSVAFHRIEKLHTSRYRGKTESRRLQARWFLGTADSSGAAGPELPASVGLIQTHKTHKSHLFPGDPSTETALKTPERGQRTRWSISWGKETPFWRIMQCWIYIYSVKEFTVRLFYLRPTVMSCLYQIAVDRVFPVLPFKPSRLQYCMTSKWLLWCELVWVGCLEKRPLNHEAQVTKWCQLVTGVFLFIYTFNEKNILCW